jgi:hypothetical protein
MASQNSRFVRNHRAVVGPIPSLAEFLAILAVASVLFLLSFLH